MKVGDLVMDDKTGFNRFIYKTGPRIGIILDVGEVNFNSPWVTVMWSSSDVKHEALVDLEVISEGG